MYFKPVVYCDEEKQAHVLHSISAPRSIAELQKYINEQLHITVQVLSYWNYSHHQYELLESIETLVQPEALLMRSDEHSRNHINLTLPSPSLSGALSSSSSLPRESNQLIYRVQLWAESSFVHLERIDNDNSSSSSNIMNHESNAMSSLELKEITEHVRLFAGNGFITYKLLRAARIRYTYVARMFDERRQKLLQDSRAAMMFYSNNSWSVPQVLTHGFCVSESVAQIHTSNTLSSINDTNNKESKINNSNTQVINYEEIMAQVQQFLESFMAHVLPQSSNNNSPCNDQTNEIRDHNSTFDESWDKNKHVNTKLHPFVFTTSLLSPQERVPQFSAIRHLQLVLLCEVACGKEYYSHTMLTQSNSEKNKRRQEQQEEEEESFHEEYDSIVYSLYKYKNKYKKKKKKWDNNKDENGNTSRSASLHRNDKINKMTENNTEGQEEEEFSQNSPRMSDEPAYKQAQVQHSYQALPRYLLLLQPLIEHNKPIHTSSWLENVEKSSLLEQEKEEKSSVKEQLLTLFSMRASSRDQSAQRRRPDNEHRYNRDALSENDKTSSFIKQKNVLVRGSRAANSEELHPIRSHSCDAHRERYGHSSRHTKHIASDDVYRNSNDHNDNNNKHHETDEESDSTHYKWHRSLLRRSHSAPRENELPTNAKKRNADFFVSNNSSTTNNIISVSRASQMAPNFVKPVSAASLSLLPPFNRVVEQIHTREQQQQQQEQQLRMKQNQLKLNSTSGQASDNIHNNTEATKATTTTTTITENKPAATMRSNNSVIHTPNEKPPLLPSSHSRINKTTTFTTTTNNNTNINNNNNNSSSMNNSSDLYSQLSLIPAEFQCTTHPKRTTSLFCKTCQKLVCPYCASVGEHKTHDTQLIQDRAKEVNSKVQLLCQTFKTNIEQCQHWQRDWRGTQIEANRQHAQRIKILQSRVNKVKSALDKRVAQLEQQLTLYVNEIRQTSIPTIVNVAQECSNILKLLETALNKYHVGRQVNGDVAIASRNARLATLMFVHDTPELLAQAEELLHKSHNIHVQEAEGNKPHSFLDNHGVYASIGIKESSVEMNAAAQTAINSNAKSDAIINQCNITTSLLHDIEEWGSHKTSITVSPHSNNNNNTHIKVNEETHLHREWNHSTTSIHDNSMTVMDDHLVKSMYNIERCLFDLQRGYIWVIQHASSLFAPGQTKTICSTPFRLLGVNWELRLTPITHSTNATTPFSTLPSNSNNNNNFINSNSNSSNREQVVISSDGSHLGCWGVNNRNNNDVATISNSNNSTSDNNTVDANTNVDGGSHSTESISSHDEWVGLFLCPCEHTLRMDYRVMVFSEVVWQEWKVTGWSSAFVGKGWGLHPFLQRKELMRTDKLAREDMVKICIAPISGLY